MSREFYLYEESITPNTLAGAEKAFSMVLDPQTFGDIDNDGDKLVTEYGQYINRNTLLTGLDFVQSNIHGSFTY